MVLIWRVVRCVVIAIGGYVLRSFRVYVDRSHGHRHGVVLVLVVRPFPVACSSGHFPSQTAKESWVHILVWLAVVFIICWDVCHSERRMDGVGSPDRSRSSADSQSPPETIPFCSFVLSDRLHTLLVYALDLLCLSLRASATHGAYDGGASADGIRTRLVLRLLLLGDGAHFVEFSFQHR
jgi:hypothetical protein